jgi:hypothetical protein
VKPGIGWKCCRLFERSDGRHYSTTKGGASPMPEGRGLRAHGFVMTRLQAADHRLHLKDLSAGMNKAASVTFVPECSGDIAQSIKVTG